MAPKKPNTDDIQARRASLSEYFPAETNPNKGTEEGIDNIANGINYVGAGRSGLADKDGHMVAGSHTLQAMEQAGIKKVIEIIAQPDEWVIVKRPDLDLDGEGAARTKAIAAQLGDNRASEVGYSPDDPLIARMLIDISDGAPQVALAAGYDDRAVRELTDLLEPLVMPEQGKNADESLQGYLNNPIKQIVIFLAADVFVSVVDRMADIAHEYDLKGNTEVFLRLLDYWESQHADLGDAETTD